MNHFKQTLAPIFKNVSFKGDKLKCKSHLFERKKALCKLNVSQIIIIIIVTIIKTGFPQIL